MTRSRCERIYGYLFITVSLFSFATGLLTSKSRVKVSDSKEARQLVRRIRTLVSKELTRRQIMLLLNSLAGHMVHNSTLQDLDNKMGEKFLRILTPDQKIDLIGSYNCYQINLDEAAIYNIFKKSRKTIADFINPGLKNIKNQLDTSDITKMSVFEQKLFVLDGLNLMINKKFIKKLFKALQKALNRKERATHSNCGGRIIMFTKYFKIS